jgi:hypothetical protein
MNFGENCIQALVEIVKRTLKPNIDEGFRVSEDQESREAFPIVPLI